MLSLVVFIFLYASESWTLTIVPEKWTQAFEMGCHRSLMNISYKDHVANRNVHRKIQVSIGNYNSCLWTRNGNAGGLAISQGLLAYQRRVCRAQCKGKGDNVNRSRDGKTILRSGQGWTCYLN